MTLTPGLGSSAMPRNLPLATFFSVQPSPTSVAIHCVGGDRDQTEGGEIEGVTGDRTFWLPFPVSSSPRTDVLSSSERVRVSDKFRVKMKYRLPSSIVMVSVGEEGGSPNGALYSPRDNLCRPAIG